MVIDKLLQNFGLFRAIDKSGNNEQQLRPFGHVIIQGVTAGSRHISFADSLLFVTSILLVAILIHKRLSIIV